jgi:hypothetical protein
MGIELLIGAGILGFILGTIAGVKTTGIAVAVPVGIFVFFLTGILGIAAYFFAFFVGAFITGS